MAVINVEIDLTKVFASQIVLNKDNKRFICLDDLQGTHIYHNQNTKAVKLKVNVSNRKEASQYGHTHTVALSQTKEEREKNGVVYVGDGKEWQQTQQAAQATPVATGNDVVDDLPF